MRDEDKVRVKDRVKDRVRVSRDAARPRLPPKPYPGSAPAGTDKTGARVGPEGRELKLGFGVLYLACAEAVVGAWVERSPGRNLYCPWVYIVV